MGGELLPGLVFASVDGIGVKPYKDRVPTGCPGRAPVGGVDSASYSRSFGAEGFEPVVVASLRNEQCQISRV